MDEIQARALEQSMAHVAQKIKLWRAASVQLEVVKKRGMNSSIPMIYEAERGLAFAERVLCGVTDSLVDEAMKVTNIIKSKEPRSMSRFAAFRGD
jgi:hypothetical protein